MAKNSHSKNLYVSLILKGKTLNPQVVTDYLGITPSKSFARGDVRANNKKWPHGYWALESSSFVDSEDLAFHLEWLANKLETVNSEILNLLKKEHDITAKISCFWIFPTGHDTLILSGELVRKLANLDLNVEFDIYSSD